MWYGRRACARSAEKLKETERERERVLWTARSFALKYAPERRAQGALCREKDRERQTSSEIGIGRGGEREREREREREM